MRRMGGGRLIASSTVPVAKSISHMSAPRSGQAPSRRRPSLSLSALPTYQPPLANSGSSAAAVATADGPKPSPLAASARPPPSIGTGPSSPHASRRRSRTPEPTPTFQRHWQPFVSPLAARPAASASFSVHLDVGFGSGRRPASTQLNTPSPAPPAAGTPGAARAAGAAGGGRGA